MTTNGEAPTDLRLARIEYALVRLASAVVGAQDPPGWWLNKEINDIVYGFKDEKILALRDGRDYEEGEEA